MRLLPVLLAVLSGCVPPSVTMTTVPTDRLLLAPTPVVPATFAGGSGLALGLTLLPVPPTTSTATGAVAHSVVQPELNGVLQIGGATSVSARASFATPTLGAQSQRTGVGLPVNAGAFDGSLGVGHDFSAESRRWGAVTSVELGLAVSTLAVSTRNTPVEVTTLLSPTVRGAVGMWGTVGPSLPGAKDGVPAPRAIRFYGGISLGTTMANDATGTRTTTCFSGCSVSETGNTTWAPVVMAGGGVRWQMSSMFSVGVEGWAVLLDHGPQIPFVGSVTLRLGTFETTPRKPKPEFVPMDPPRWEEVAPPSVPPPPV